MESQVSLPCNTLSTPNYKPLTAPHGGRRGKWGAAFDFLPLYLSLLSNLVRVYWTVETGLFVLFISTDAPFCSPLPTPDPGQLEVWRDDEPEKEDGAIHAGPYVQWVSIGMRYSFFFYLFFFHLFLLVEG